MTKKELYDAPRNKKQFSEGDNVWWWITYNQDPVDPILQLCMSRRKYRADQSNDCVVVYSIADHDEPWGAALTALKDLEGKMRTVNLKEGAPPKIPSLEELKAQMFRQPVVFVSESSVETAAKVIRKAIADAKERIYQQTEGEYPSLWNSPIFKLYLAEVQLDQILQTLGLENQGAILTYRDPDSKQ